MNDVLMIVMAAGAVLGGVDRLRGNRWGLGDKFETGFMLLGSMALSMAGMICLTPVLAQWLGQAIVPLYRLIGVDPAMFGSLLAIDMGGYQLAKELAEDPLLGSYAGLVAASIFGCTLVFTIPVGMGMIPQADRPLFARGIMLGLSAMPVGLVIGGLLCGLPVLVCLHQNLPIFALALLLLLGLWKFPHRMVKGFILLSESIRWLVTIGLVLAAVEYMTGWCPFPGMAPLEDALATVSSIGIVPRHGPPGEGGGRGVPCQRHQPAGSPHGLRAQRGALHAGAFDSGQAQRRARGGGSGTALTGKGFRPAGDRFGKIGRGLPSRQERTAL